MLTSNTSMLVLGPYTVTHPHRNNRNGLAPSPTKLARLTTFALWTKRACADFVSNLHCTIWIIWYSHINLASLTIIQWLDTRSVGDRDIALTRAENSYTVGRMYLICCCWRVSEITGKGLDLGYRTVWRNDLQGNSLIRGSASRLCIYLFETSPVHCANETDFTIMHFAAHVTPTRPVNTPSPRCWETSAICGPNMKCRFNADATP